MASERPMRFQKRYEAKASSRGDAFTALVEIEQRLKDLGEEREDWFRALEIARRKLLGIG